MRSIKKILVFFLFVMLEACATQHTSMPMHTGAYNTYSPSITTNSYMYRSPPPAMMSGGMMHGS